MSTSPTSLLIVRAWIEPHSSEPLRARIRLTTNVANGIERELTLAGVRGICDAVETWLEDLLAADQAV